jgi:hypothetical protein
MKRRRRRRRMRRRMRNRMRSRMRSRMRNRMRSRIAPNSSSFASFDKEKEKLLSRDSFCLSDATGNSNPVFSAQNRMLKLQLQFFWAGWVCLESPDATTMHADAEKMQKKCNFSSSALKSHLLQLHSTF